MKPASENLVKCQCQHCKGNLEFDTTECKPGTVIECPHCLKQTELYIPEKKPDLKPFPKETAVTESRLEICPDCLGSFSGLAKICPHCGRPRFPKEHYSSTALHIFAILVFLVGCGLGLVGFVIEAGAKTAFQEGPAFLLGCTGAILIALSIMTFGLARIVEAIENQ